MFAAIAILSFISLVASAPHLQRRLPQYGIAFQEDYTNINYDPIVGATSASHLTDTPAEPTATHVPAVGAYVNSTADYAMLSSSGVSSKQSDPVYIDNPHQRIYSTDAPASTLFITVSPLPYPTLPYSYEFLISDAPESSSCAPATEAETSEAQSIIATQNTGSTSQHSPFSVYYSLSVSTAIESTHYPAKSGAEHFISPPMSDSAHGGSSSEHPVSSAGNFPVIYTAMKSIDHPAVAKPIASNTLSYLTGSFTGSSSQQSASSTSYPFQVPVTGRKDTRICRAVKTVFVTKTLSLTPTSSKKLTSSATPPRDTLVGPEPGITAPLTRPLVLVPPPSELPSIVLIASLATAKTSSYPALGSVSGGDYQNVRQGQYTSPSLPSPSLEYIPFPPSSVSTTAGATYFVASRSALSTSVAFVAPPAIKYASGSSIIAPAVIGTNLHGPSSNEPTTQYIKVKSPLSPKLSADLLTVGVNGALSTNYGLSSDTGVLEINAANHDLLTDLKGKPHISRDGGKGGYLNGQHLFIFCDTGSYAPANGSQKANFVGFVSSSVAVDKGKNGLYGKSLVLEDGIGQWSDDVGRMRGFAPLTGGEQSYNKAMQGHGQRYAIWAESSLIPFNQSHALIYAPIVYDNVDKIAQKTTFTYTGSTLLAITAGGSGGPRSDRIVSKIFNQDDAEWGVIGGLRSYGPSGIGGNDGWVYVFACVTGGLLTGRVDADQITSRGSYEYWNGNSWMKQMPSKTSTAYAISGSFMDGDIFYSPAHLTFIFVYLNPLADNTFYYRYLMAPTAIRPSTAVKGTPFSDYAENIVKYPWSHEILLYEAPKGPTGKYIYAGGVHLGYYGVEDISNGGRKALLSWTVPTGVDAASQESEYSLMTAETTFH